MLAVCASATVHAFSHLRTRAHTHATFARTQTRPQVSIVCRHICRCYVNLSKAVYMRCASIWSAHAASAVYSAHQDRCCAFAEIHFMLSTLTLRCYEHIHAQCSAL